MADHIEKWGGAWSMCQSTVFEIPLNTTALTFVGAVLYKPLNKSAARQI